MSTITAPSRLDRIKHRQAAAQAGVRGAALRTHGTDVVTDDRRRKTRRPAASAVEGLTGADKETSTFASADSLEVDLMSHFDAAAEHALRKEFDETLFAIGQVHGYKQEDSDFVRNHHLPEGVDLFEDLTARTSVKERIRSWLVDLVVFDWVAPADLEHLARRARSTFRMDVMGMLEDENGTPYPGVATRQFIEKAKRSSTSSKRGRATMG
ncbi:hypothetical protein [Hydrogenophaga sp. 2FB]|uniref:hypothetical protein n=1 Tax=Hydrogenophaga sp. 2FB TaxID=2502187 RepID=UPI0010F9B571|nr:hypothetical protein [Hydrogenophaga sp. 2FB]